MTEKELEFKLSVIDVEIDKLTRDIEYLEERVKELKNDLAYLKLLEELDREYGDMFENK